MEEIELLELADLAVLRRVKEALDDYIKESDLGRAKLGIRRNGHRSGTLTGVFSHPICIERALGFVYGYAVALSRE